jgi:hypothetical protein
MLESLSVSSGIDRGNTGVGYGDLCLAITSSFILATFRSVLLMIVILIAGYLNGFYECKRDASIHEHLKRIVRIVPKYIFGDGPLFLGRRPRHVGDSFAYPITKPSQVLSLLRERIQSGGLAVTCEYGCRSCIALTHDFKLAQPLLCPTFREPWVDTVIQQIGSD